MLRGMKRDYFSNFFQSGRRDRFNSIAKITNSRIVEFGQLVLSYFHINNRNKKNWNLMKYL